MPRAPPPHTPALMYRHAEKYPRRIFTKVTTLPLHLGPNNKYLKFPPIFKNDLIFKLLLLEERSHFHLITFKCPSGYSFDNFLIQWGDAYYKEIV